MSLQLLSAVLITSNINKNQDKISDSIFMNAFSLTLQHSLIQFSILCRIPITQALNGDNVHNCFGGKKGYNQFKIHSVAFVKHDDLRLLKKNLKSHGPATILSPIPAFCSSDWLNTLKPSCSSDISSQYPVNTRLNCRCEHGGADVPPERCDMQPLNTA